MRILVLLFALFFSIFVRAQTDSTVIKLNYYKQLFSNGDITNEEYQALRKQVLGIKDNAGASGQTQIVYKSATKVPMDTLNPDTAYKRGYQDASDSFKTRGIFAGTICTTIFATPLFGLIPAIACSSTEPKEENLRCPDYDNLMNPHYKRGYMDKARKMKIANAWEAWSVGTAIDLVIGLTVGIVVKTKQSNQH